MTFQGLKYTDISLHLCWKIYVRIIVHKKGNQHRKIFLNMKCLYLLYLAYVIDATNLKLYFHTGESS
jgi:hypothetical protein